MNKFIIPYFLAAGSILPIYLEISKTDIGLLMFVIPLAPMAYVLGLMAIERYEKMLKFPENKEII
jgi:hypothetical protein